MSEETRMGYQPALDGLRALSVIAVILYHAGVQWIPGGFIGVEVFFVVSGFLITSLMIDEQHVSGKPEAVLDQACTSFTSGPVHHVDCRTCYGDIFCEGLCTGFPSRRRAGSWLFLKLVADLFR